MSNSNYTFSDFWQYNKFKIFSLILVLFLIVLALTQCSWGEKADLGIIHACETDGANGELFTQSIRKDILNDETGEMDIVFTAIYIPPERSKQLETRALEQLQIELSVGDNSLYIVDEETLYAYSPDGLFENITDLADHYLIPDDMRYLDENGNVIAISVDSNEYFASNGVFSDALYICTRAGDREDYINAYKVLNHILENR